MQELMKLWERYSDIGFWIHFIEQFRAFGPLAPIFLAFIESVIPALPLIVIISFNVGVYGPVLGFMYSWLGTMLGSFTMFCFYRYFVKIYLLQWVLKKQSVEKVLSWISQHRPVILFILTALPFTPSSIINLGYGLSNFPMKTFFITILCSKALMTLSMTLFGHSLTQMKEQPLLIVGAVILLYVLYRLSKSFSKKYLQ